MRDSQMCKCLKNLLAFQLQDPLESVDELVWVMRQTFAASDGRRTARTLHQGWHPEEMCGLHLQEFDALVPLVHFALNCRRLLFEWCALSS